MTQPEAFDNVEAIVLAAGLSRRMGQPKPLLMLGERPLLAHVIESLSAGGIRSIVVVTGHAAAEVSRVAEAFGARTVHNPDYAAGPMLSSVKTGVGAVASNAQAILLTLVDQPLVQADTIRALVNRWRASGAAIVLPRHQGRHGHPILLDARGVAEILSIPDDQTLKTYVDAHRNQSIEVDVDDPAVLFDVDTPEDYKQAMTMLAERSQRS